jgi:hypothetical protein
MYLSFVWDETPHLLALALLPVTVLSMKAAVEGGRKTTAIAAVCSIAVMLLASAFAVPLLVIAAVCLIASVAPQLGRREYSSLNRISPFIPVMRAAASAQGDKGSRGCSPVNGKASRGCWLLPLLGIGGWALVSPWMPPSLWWTIRRNAANNPESAWSRTSLVELAILAAGFFVLRRVLRRCGASAFLCFVALFAWMVTGVAVFHQYLGWHFLPQSGRYKVEVDWVWPMLIVFAVVPLFRHVPRALSVTLCVALLAAAYGRVVSHRRYAKVLMQDGTRFAHSIERHAALLAEQSLPGQRVLFVGSMAQWTNLFADVPQMTGGSFPTAYNPVQRLASEAVIWSTTAQAETGVLWMKAYGVHAVAVPGLKSPEFWKPMRNPTIFESRLPVLWREEDTTIYSVPHTTDSLARVVPRSALVRSPAGSAMDLGEVRRYVAAIDDPSSGRASFRWLDRAHAVVHASAQPGEVVSVQINYHTGWTARCGQETMAVNRDGLGLLWINGGCKGDIALTYDGGVEAKALKWLSVVTAVGCLGWWLSGVVWPGTRSASARTARAARDSRVP